MPKTMRRAGFTVLACALSFVVRAQKPEPAAAPTVVLDISVTDQKGQPVTDLRQEDFQIEDDGRRYPATNFARISLHGTPADSDIRTVALVLDDAGVPAAGTGSVQAISSIFLGSMMAADAVSVIRLHNTADGLAPRWDTSMGRVAGYQGGAFPFFQEETPEDFLRMVSRLSREWEKTTPRRRRAIVCVGSPATCNNPERESIAVRDLYTNWVDAMTAAARGHVIVYAAVPALATMTGGGLLERTGGALFAGNSDFKNAVARVLSDVSEYYLIAYTPQPSKRDLRPVSVRVSKRDVRVRMRNRR
jgi:hypothetical protein